MTSDSSSDTPELFSQVGDILDTYKDELSTIIHTILESTALYHERLIPAEELLHISTQETHRLISAFLNNSIKSTPEKIKEYGAQFAYTGLGDRSLSEMIAVWLHQCITLVVRDHPDVKYIACTAKAVSGYTTLFVEGYLTASRDRILDAQDEMVVALEQSLRESEQWLATTLRSIGDGVIATDTKGLVSFMNVVAELLTGWTQKEAVGAPLHEVFYIVNEHTRKRCFNPFEKIMKTGKIVGLANSTVLIARDGTERVIADSGAPIRDEEGNIFGTVLVFRDVTEKRKMEDNILRLKAEKMESISILAGGIAHDFNNILTAILGNVTIAKMHSAPDGEVCKLLTEAEKASLRAKDLTQQLLTFSKGGAPVKKPASLVELLQSTAGFALSGSKTRCEFSFADDLSPAEIDAGQISQVINNLIINADQAMPGGGVIVIRAENVAISPGDDISLPEGRYIKIKVEDQGIGIPRDHLQRIFEPYFTTKQKGSGLGLATSYSIVKNHDGIITVESKLGVGTTFYIYLPASEKEIQKKEEKLEKKKEKKGKILLMDDEESILEATSEVLNYLGYDVQVAKDGEKAVALYKKALEKNPFDAVILDLTIKGNMDGRETIHALKTIDPQVKAIVSSGYSDDPVMANYSEYGFEGVVVKPYTIDELNTILCTVLKE
ncbi:MAG: ATP-binding protein [Candidatus Methanofastidiosia archaeon]|jgi:PAS domain S-box-containing protein